MEDLEDFGRFWSKTVATRRRENFLLKKIHLSVVLI
jgi:hypothetical protein